MGDTIPIQLASKSSRTRGLQEGATRLVNCYAELLGSEAKSKFGVYAIAGLTTWATRINSGPCRAMIAVDNVLLVVMGRLVVSVDESGLVTVLGGLESDGLVTMDMNLAAPPQVGIVCDGEYLLYRSGSLSSGESTYLPPPNSITALDGYFILLIDDSRFFVTNANDGGTIGGGGTYTATASGSAGKGVRVTTRNRDVVIFKTVSMEFWADSGGADFPFSRTTTVDVGCYAAGSVCKVVQIAPGQATNDTVIWAATDSNGSPIGVYMLNGYAPQKISEQDLDRLLQAEPDPSVIRATAWNENGHSFYAISGAAWTKVYDAATGFWHDRQSYGLNRWRCGPYARFNGLDLFGDYASGTIYSSNIAYYDEVGQPIIAVNDSPVVHAWPARLRWNALYVDAVLGVGGNSQEDQAIVSDGGGTITTEDGVIVWQDGDGDPSSDYPKLLMALSHDGGKTFGAPRAGDVGAQGQTIPRVRPWRRLGVAPPNGRTVRLYWSASVFRGLIGMAIDADKLSA